MSRPLLISSIPWLSTIPVAFQTLVLGEKGSKDRGLHLGRVILRRIAGFKKGNTGYTSTLRDRQ